MFKSSNPIRIYKYTNYTQNKKYVAVYLTKNNLYRLENRDHEFELSCYDENDEFLTLKDFYNKFNPAYNTYEILYFGDNEKDDEEYTKFFESEFPSDKIPEEDIFNLSQMHKILKFEELLQKLPQPFDE